MTGLRSVCTQAAPVCSHISFYTAVQSSPDYYSLVWGTVWAGSVLDGLVQVFIKTRSIHRAIP